MSSIEWTQETWNPTTGCSHFSKWGECSNCYAEILTKRNKAWGLKKYSEGFNKVVEHESELDLPYKWKKPRTVFVNSMSDLFHKDISLDFIKRVFEVMNNTPQHTYQILTKRDRKLEEYSSELNWTDNIWMGVSVGAQGATRRIPQLVNCNAKHKFLSIEPFIEEIKSIKLDGIDWVIVGGESGTRSRPIKKEWVNFIKDKCEEYKVPFFFKQWGDKKWNPNQDDPTISSDHKFHSKGGCQLDGKVYWSNPSIPEFKIDSIELFGEEFQIMDNQNDLVTIWELKTYLPNAEKEKYKELKNDIKENGQNDPVLYWKSPSGLNLVIEGHTRLKACIELKIDAKSKAIEQDFKSIEEIKFWMIKHQLQRRNLSATERVKYAYMSKDVIQHKAKENLSKAGKGEKVSSIDTYEEIAKLAGVGRTTVVRYNDVITKGSKNIVSQLHSEKLSIGMAHSKIKENKNTEKKPPSKTNDLVISNYKSIDDGIKAIEDGEIEHFLITLDDNPIRLLKKRPGEKIGIFNYLTSN